MSLLGDLESRVPVKDWTIDGVRVWPLFRVLLYSHLSISLRGPEPSRGRTLASKPALLLDACLAPFREPGRNLPRTAPAEVFVLSYAAVRQARLPGGCFDIRTGPIIEDLTRRRIGSHVWEYSQTVPYRFPRHNPTHLVQREFYLSRLLRRTPREIRLRDFAAALETLRSHGVDFPFLREEPFVAGVVRLLALRDRFDRALEAIDPCLAFTSNTGPYELALNLACRRRDIPTIELQHGVFGPLHGHYSGWTSVPPEGYELLPFSYWCWDTAAAGPINQWAGACAPRHQAVVGGNPWLDYCEALDPGPDDGRKKVLVTLAPPERVYPDGRLLPEFVLDAFSKADKSWVWWVRPHPLMTPELPELEAEFRRRGLDADFETARESPLPLLLRRADLHATHSSSAVAEADRCGVGSVVWSRLGADLSAEWIVSGACDVAFDADALASALVRRMGLGRRRPAPSPAPPFPETLDRYLELGRRMKAARRRS